MRQETFRWPRCWPFHRCSGNWGRNRRPCSSASASTSARADGANRPPFGQVGRLLDECAAASACALRLARRQPIGPRGRRNRRQSRRACGVGARGAGVSGKLSRSGRRGRRLGRRDPAADARRRTRCRSARHRHRADGPRLEPHGHRDAAFERQGRRGSGKQAASAARAARGRGYQRQGTAPGPALQAGAAIAGGLAHADREGPGN